MNPLRAEIVRDLLVIDCPKKRTCGGRNRNQQGHDSQRFAPSQG
jgi:hypothetical protein